MDWDWDMGYGWDMVGIWLGYGWDMVWQPREQGTETETEREYPRTGLDYQIGFGGFGWIRSLHVMMFDRYPLSLTLPHSCQLFDSGSWGGNFLL